MRFDLLFNSDHDLLLVQLASPATDEGWTLPYHNERQGEVLDRTQIDTAISGVEDACVTAFYTLTAETGNRSLTDFSVRLCRDTLQDRLKLDGRKYRDHSWVNISQLETVFAANTVMSELIWSLYTETILKGYQPELRTTRVRRFGENPERARLFASRIAEGKTTAAARSSMSYEYRGEPLPAPGETAIVTDWEGSATAVIRFTEVDVVPFSEMSSEYILQTDEAEPVFLKEVYKGILEREAVHYGWKPDDDMPIVCQKFHVIRVLG